MADTTTTSGFLNLNWQDAIKGALVAAGSAAADTIYQILATPGGLSGIDWASVGKVALLAAVGYLIKNLFTPAKTVTPVAK